MTTSNPFRPTRYEHHSKPLLWLSPSARQLEGEGSFYVSGSRGSGKTSLLKTLHWREREFNDTLKEQLASRKPAFLSIYFRIPDHISGALASVDWARILPDAPDPSVLSFQYFSGLLESIAAQLICEALDEKRIAGSITFSAGNAAAEIAKFTSRYPHVTQSGNNHPVSFSDLGSLFERLHGRLNVMASRGEARAALRYLPEDEPGNMLLALAEIAARLIAPKATTTSQFQIKICVDDCEVLRNPQQKFLNTLVRRARSPVSWIVSYVGTDYEATTCITPDHSLSSSDRLVVDLDAQTEQTFVRLCEAVSSLRTYYSLSEQQRDELKLESIDEFFSVQRVLGTRDVNVLIDTGLKGSLSYDFQKFREKALRIQDVLDSVRVTDTRKARRMVEMFPHVGAPPYYQTYLLEHQSLLQKTGTIENDIIGLSKQELARLNAYLRRKQRAAFIAICNQYRIKNIPYAGRAVVFGLSDGSIRDYLEIMADIFDEYAMDKNKILRFVARTEPLTIETQRAGAVVSAENKFTGIRENIETHPVELSRLVDCIGHLTALLHRDIRTAERGVFTFDPSDVKEFDSRDAADVTATIVRVINRGLSENLLKMDDTTAVVPDGGVKAFRLHRRFAPKYGFSYRGPYEAIQLPGQRLAEICLTPQKIEPLKWATDVYNALARVDEAQGILLL